MIKVNYRGLKIIVYFLIFVIQDPAKKEEMLKPTNPEAQKALTSSVQYKVSSRPIIKLKPRPLLAFNNGKVCCTHNCTLSFVLNGLHPTLFVTVISF